MLKLKAFTLDRDFWFASIVTSPAQQTKALELDRPELGGTVPSTTHDIPARRAISNFSWENKYCRRMSEASFYYWSTYYHLFLSL